MKNIQLSVEQARGLLGKNPEVDQIIRANFTEEELNPKPKFPKSWDDISHIEGFFVKSTAEISECSPRSPRSADKSVFATKQQAKSALAAAQLSQLMKAYNGDWEQPYSNDASKFVIERIGHEICCRTYYMGHQFLTFRTDELRDEFLKNFEPLIKQYFEL